MIIRLALMLLPVALAAGGCAPNAPLTVDAQPGGRAGVSARYERGVLLQESRQTTAATVVLLEATEQALLFEIGLDNLSQTGFDIGADDIALTLAPATTDASADPAVPGKVFSYQELRASGDHSLAWDSASVVTGAVVPSVVGGVGGTVARGFIGLGMDRAKQRDAASNKPPAENYFRRQTLAPGGYYAGIVKIGLPRPPTTNDTLILTVKTPLDRHRFSYRIAP